MGIAGFGLEFSELESHEFPLQGLGSSGLPFAGLELFQLVATEVGSLQFGLQLSEAFSGHDLFELDFTDCVFVDLVVIELDLEEPFDFCEYDF